MKVLNWAFVLALTAIAVSFALSNDQTTELAIWPVPYTMDVPVYVAVMGAFVVGFFCGGMVVWLGRIAARRKERARARRDADPERDEAQRSHPDTAGTAPASDSTAVMASTPSLPATGR